VGDGGDEQEAGDGGPEGQFIQQLGIGPQGEGGAVKIEIVGEDGIGLVVADDPLKMPWTRCRNPIIKLKRRRPRYVLSF